MSSPWQIVPNTPDVLVCNEGTVFLFCPLTPRSKAWIDEFVQPDAQWFGNALVVEHRFAWGLAQGMKDAGLVLEGREMKLERVALYAPVSTLAGQSPEMQLVELREYAGRRGWNVVGEYVDHGVSGTKESRPALNRLMADAKQRRFDVIAVWKIDRFGRSLRHLVNSLAELENLGVSFVGLRDSLDLSSPAGRLMAQLLGAISEFERNLITERVRAGIRNARNKGRTLGRPRLEVDGGRIARLRNSGASLRTISKQLGISLGSVHRALQARSNNP